MKISLSYPTSWLTINVSVYKLPSETLDNSGVCNEVWTTWVYIYTFTDDGASDYSYVATCSWYNELKWTVFYEATWGWGGGWGASVADIWGAQISDYAWTIWSFARKFSEYWGASHVMQAPSSWELSKADKEVINKNKELLEKIDKKLSETKVEVWLTKKDVEDIVRTINVSPIVNIPKFDLSPLVQSLDLMKKSIDKSLEPKPKEDSVVDELVVETIPELIDSIDTINSQMKNIDSQIDTLTDVISSYEEALRKAEEDKANYKKLVQELTK